MDKYYLAVDIGASSGRHMLASMKDGKMQLEEVYRFPNGMTEKNGTLCWDVERLFTEIKNGLKVCKELGKIPVSMAIDTWAVDYVLLDENDKILGDTAGYRDSRTNGMDEKVYEKIPLGALYARTGIQKQIFNTIYQLMAVKENYPEQQNHDLVVRNSKYQTTDRGSVLYSGRTVDEQWRYCKKTGESCTFSSRKSTGISGTDKCCR